MSLIQEVQERSGNQCELCAITDNLTVYNVAIIQNICIFAKN